MLFVVMMWRYCHQFLLAIIILYASNLIFHLLMRSTLSQNCHVGEILSKLTGMAFVIFLSGVDWHAAFCNCSSAEQLWEAFTVVVHQAVNNFVPFSVRCNIYISRLCYDVSVRLSVTELHWCIITNLSFKFRSQFTEHSGRGACSHKGTDHHREEWMIISRYPSHC